MAYNDVDDRTIAYEQIVDSVGIGISLISPNMEILILNKKMREWFPQLDISKKPICYRSFNSPPRDQICSYCPTVKTLEDGLIHEAITHTPAGDKIIYYRVISTPLKDKNGNISAVIEMVEDITRHKKAEEELEAFSEKLRQSNSELGQFAYIASHDLQEPLRKVTAFGDRLKDKYAEALGEQGKDYLERMQSAAGRMQVLINDLLTYSRVTTKAQPFTSTDLSAITKEVLSDLEIRVEQAKGRVEVGELPVIEADPLQMRQLMQNLICNALKFTKKNEAPVVKVQGAFANGNGSSRDEYYQITVEDNGIGFDEQYSERIFGVFQRLHGRSEYEGSGIGLSICKKIVERHGGNIKAKSAAGHGAKFLITLPVKHYSTGGNGDN